MDNFAIIYKILKALEKAMDTEEFDMSMISCDRLGVAYPRWEKIMIMLVKAGYLEGVAFDQCMSDYSPKIQKPIQPVITLKGLEYLADNTLMKKAANVIKGMKEAIPRM